MLKALFQSNDRKLRKKTIFGVKDYITYRQQQYIIDPNAIYRTGMFNTPTIMFIEGYAQPCNFFNVDDLPKKEVFNTNNVALILKKLFRYQNFEELMLILMVIMIIGLIILGVSLFDLSNKVEGILPYVAQ